MRDLSFTLCWLFTRVTCIYLWWSFQPHVVLSLPSSGSLIIVRLSVTHKCTHTALQPRHRPDQFHQRSLAQMFLQLKWQDPQRRSNKCLLTPLLSSFQFISFGVPRWTTWITFNAIMEVTNYSPCNFIVQCTNKQHNPPFITWSCVFESHMNVGRNLNKSKTRWSSEGF